MILGAFHTTGLQAYDEDIRFVDRFLEGDSAAFRTLYERYYEKVLSIARGIVLDADEAADATQEVFAQVYRNLHRFDRRSRFSTWLYRIAVNRCIQYSRTLKNKRRTVALSDLPETAEVEGALVEPADPRVETSMRRLSQSDRAILTLFYWEDMSLEEVSKALGCNLNAAKTRLFRARERFRVFFEEEQ